MDRYEEILQFVDERLAEMSVEGMEMGIKALSKAKKRMEGV